MQIQLSPRDILYAAILALFITWMITGIMKNFRIVITKPTEFVYPPEEVKKILQRCYMLFPKEIILFHGRTYRRGMIVRIVTTQQKVIQGQLIGQNNDNMVCVLTDRHVVAHDLGHIEEIAQIEG